MFFPGTPRACRVWLSPDGSRLATGSFDHTARIWSVPQGRPLATLEGHQAEVSRLAWSPDGRTIATGSYDESLRLWDSDGTFRRSFDNLGSYVTGIAFTADSSGLLYAQGGNPARSVRSCFATIIDVATGQIRARFTKHDSTLYGGIFSPGGSLVAELRRRRASTSISGGRPTRRWSNTWPARAHQVELRLGADGQSIAWGNNSLRKVDNDKGPLEYSFRWGELQFGDPPDGSFRRANVVRGSLSLGRKDPYHVDVKRAGEVIATMALPATTSNHVLSYTFLSR